MINNTQRVFNVTALINKQVLQFMLCKHDYIVSKKYYLHVQCRSTFVRVLQRLKAIEA